eukprot:gene622-681_t
MLAISNYGQSASRCFDFDASGSCKRGDGCRYLHVEKSSSRAALEFPSNDQFTGSKELIPKQSRVGNSSSNKRTESGYTRKRSEIAPMNKIPEASSKSKIVSVDTENSDVIGNDKKIENVDYQGQFAQIGDTSVNADDESTNFYTRNTKIDPSLPQEGNTANENRSTHSRTRGNASNKERSRKASRRKHSTKRDQEEVKSRGERLQSSSSVSEGQFVLEADDINLGGGRNVQEAVVENDIDGEGAGHLEEEKSEENLYAAAAHGGERVNDTSDTLATAGWGSTASADGKPSSEGLPTLQQPLASPPASLGLAVDVSSLSAEDLERLHIAYRGDAASDDLFLQQLKFNQLIALAAAYNNSEGRGQLLGQRQGEELIPGGAGTRSGGPEPALIHDEVPRGGVAASDGYSAGDREGRGDSLTEGVTGVQGLKSWGSGGDVGWTTTTSAAVRQDAGNAPVLAEGTRSGLLSDDNSASLRATARDPGYAVTEKGGRDGGISSTREYNFNGGDFNVGDQRRFIDINAGFIPGVDPTVGYDYYPRGEATEQGSRGRVEIEGTNSRNFREGGNTHTDGSYGRSDHDISSYQNNSMHFNNFIVSENDSASESAAPPPQPPHQPIDPFLFHYLHGSFPPYLLPHLSALQMSPVGPPFPAYPSPPGLPLSSGISPGGSTSVDPALNIYGNPPLANPNMMQPSYFIAPSNTNYPLMMPPQSFGHGMYSPPNPYLFNNYAYGSNGQPPPFPPLPPHLFNPINMSPYELEGQRLGQQSLSESNQQPQQSDIHESGTVPSGLGGSLDRGIGSGLANNSPANHDSNPPPGLVDITAVSPVPGREYGAVKSSDFRSSEVQTHGRSASLDTTGSNIAADVALSVLQDVEGSVLQDILETVFEDVRSSIKPVMQRGRSGGGKLDSKSVSRKFPVSLVDSHEDGDRVDLSDRKLAQGSGSASGPSEGAVLPLNFGGTPSGLDKPVLSTAASPVSYPPPDADTISITTSSSTTRGESRSADVHDHPSALSHSDNTTATNVAVEVGLSSLERPTSKRVDGRQYRGAKDLGVAKGHGSLIRFRPQEDLVAHWELSPENLKIKENSSSALSNTTEKNENNDSSSNGTEIPSYLLAIGLFRFGQSQNATPMFMKKLSLIKFTIRNGCKVFAGSHNFFAPKEAGQFVFRVYSTRSELSHFTVATSNPLLVYLKGEDLSNSLERLSTIFAAEENNSVLLPLTSHISHFHSLVQCASPDDQSQHRKQSTMEFERKASEHLKSCFHSLLEFAQKAMVKYSELLEVERSFYESLKSETRGSDMTVIEESARDGKESTSTNTITTAGEGSASAVEKSSSADSVLNKKHYSNKKLFSRIQCDTYDALMDMTRNYYIMTLLPAPQQRALEMILNFFCPIQRRFFESTEAMEKSLVGYLGFAPGSPRVVANVPYAEQLKVFSALNQSISESLPGWFPAYDFSLKREAIRLRLLHMLLENKVLPTGSELVIFGSSRNNFGMDSSDLDMCILYPNNDLNPSRTSGGVSVQTEYSQKSAAIQQIGDFLREQSEMFENVQVRATARIPIVIFEDKLSGLECDISFNNPLALQNTALLNLYSRLDDRVRPLAYLIKIWAKNRKINNPFEGTLSSYGYILTLIYFLQNTQPPVLPNLQAIPAEWSGEERELLDLIKAGSPGANPPPVHWDMHPVTGVSCNTYFYHPHSNSRQFLTLKEIGSRNRATVGELFADYIKFYATTFDTRHVVVSVRRGAIPLLKLEKAEESCWPTYERWSIEDPFETFYDVAHVMHNASKDYLIRREFQRAYALIARALTNSSDVEPLSGEPTDEISGSSDKLNKRDQGSYLIPPQVPANSLLSLLLEERKIIKEVGGGGEQVDDSILI